MRNPFGPNGAHRQLLRRVGFRSGPGELARTCAIIALTSFAAFLVRPERGEVAGALIFVLGITLVGAIDGLVAALVAAMAGFLLYNFYFAEPVLKFRLSSGNDLAPLIIFNLCALIAGVLAGRLKDRAQAALRANRQLERLLNLSRALQSALTAQDIVVALGGGSAGQSSLRAHLYRRDITGSIESLTDPLSHFADIVDHILQHDEIDLLRSDRVLAFRLEGARGSSEVMLLEESEEGWDEPAYVAALANLTSLALERSALSERLAEATANAKIEELKTALLSSVSHDFRTPLAAISASASSLIDYRDQLDRPTSMTLLRGIVSESERLNRYTANLLELTRLEAGQPAAQLQTLGVSDMLTAAVRRLRPRAGERRIELSLGGSDPLVEADPVLFELVLVNVIENAILYSDDNTTITIEATSEPGWCQISVMDEGWGIPLDQLTRVFERFVQIPRPGAPARGSGLGLAIAKGFVDALGGSIEAKVADTKRGGTEMRIRLPLVASLA